MLRITGGTVLGEDGLHPAAVMIEAGLIREGGDASGPSLDATGCLVLPGLVDIHGDAFERQVEPRSGVGFPLDMALFETDRQLVANGITTALHGVTASWEPGLRSFDRAREMLDTLEALRPALSADTRFHLRHEPYNLDAEAEIVSWITARRIACIAYNDHVPDILKKRGDASRIAKEVQRSGLSIADYEAMLLEVSGRADEVPGSIERLAAAARSAGVPQLSHDDDTAEMRRWYRGLGAAIAEFPETLEAATEAARLRDPTVFGAPNVVRGGSHCGAVDAAPMVAAGIGTILASDYFYPALLAAPFRLVVDGVADFGTAWNLVSRNPALALGLDDRGALTPGSRADVVVVDATRPAAPRVVATVVAGRIVHLTDGGRLS